VAFFNIIAIAVALAMDTFAVAIVTGATLKNIKPRQVFRLSWHFGFFQAMMPVIGWSAGLSVRDYIEKYDHWIAFALLAFVAAKMLKDAFETHDDNKHTNDPTKGSSLVLLSVATSIDALAVGLSLSVIEISVWTPAFIIGVIAALFTIAGLYLGSRVSNVTIISRYAEVIGGIVLFVIGINILYEHGALTI
jgi:putative Mn2+ efflux pump MntP